MFLTGRGIAEDIAAIGKPLLRDFIQLRVRIMVGPDPYAFGGSR